MRIKARNRFPVWMVLAILSLLVVSCQPLPQPPATPIPTQAVTATVLQPTLTLPPTETPGAEVIQPTETAVVPTEAAIPTQELTAAPVDTPVPQPLGQTGPFLLVSASTGLWAANEDGSGLTKMTGDPVIAPENLQNGVAPNNHLAAFVTGDEDQIHHLKLNLLSLPDGTVKTITALTNARTEPGDASILDAKVEAARAISGNSLAWSPDGQTLAFIGIQDGPSADLYTYTPATGKIARLSDGPAQAYGPVWSPDGKYIVNFGVTTFGTGAGYSMAGGWATRADGSGITTLFGSGVSTQEFRGWVSDHEFLIGGWTPACGPQDLRIFDLLKMAETSLFKGCFIDAAVAENNGLIMVVAEGSAGAGQPALYAFGPDDRTRRELPADGPESVAYFASGDLLVGLKSGYAIYGNNGDLLIKAPEIGCKNRIGYAGYGAIYAWTCDSGNTGVWINGPGIPDRQIIDQTATLPVWSPNNTLLFFHENTLFHAFFMSYQPEPVSTIQGKVLDAAWMLIPE